MKLVMLNYWTARSLQAVIMQLTTDMHGCPGCRAFPPAGHDEGCPVASLNVSITAADGPATPPARTRTPARRSSGRGGARPGAGRKSNRGGARPGAGRKPAKVAKKRTPAKKTARPRPSRAKKKSAHGGAPPPSTGTGSPATPPA